MEFHPTRRTVRLPSYDYSQEGAYFITLCTEARASLFGEVNDGAIRLSRIGQIVQDEWERTPHVRPEIALDSFVIMPNHLHAIVMIVGPPLSQSTIGRTSRAPLQRPKRSLSTLVAGFKATTALRVKQALGYQGKLWQRNYYEHIIRNEFDLHRIREYIHGNPGKWEEDPENPNRRQRFP